MRTLGWIYLNLTNPTKFITLYKDNFQVSKIFDHLSSKTFKHSSPSLRHKQNTTIKQFYCIALWSWLVIGVSCLDENDYCHFYQT